VFELYTPRLPWFYSVSRLADPCVAGSPERSGPDAAEVEALCLAQGVPDALLPDFIDQDQVHQGVQGGNPDLAPESGDTLTLGFAWTSRSAHRLLSGMQLSVDWYRIEMEDAIEWVYATEFVPYCFDPRTNPGYEPSSPWCTRFSRDVATGEIVDFVDTFDNIAGFELSGIDLQFDWRVAVGTGHLGLNALVSWMDTFKVQPPPGLPETDRVGQVGDPFAVGRSFPEWKANVNLSYDWEFLGLGVQWRYVDAMMDADLELDYEVPSYDYFDLYVSYSIDAGVLAGLAVRAGIENLTDEQPPLLPSWVGANTDPSQYDVMGRRYHLNLSYRF
jgi:iron complex outermembrane receptor protein